MNIWTRLARKTAPGATPVTLDEAKAQCRVSFSDEDAFITSLIERAVATIDGPRGIGVCMVTQAWVLSLDAFPTCVALPMGPMKGVDAVKYVDADGVEQTLAPTEYLVDTGGEVARISPAYGKTWPPTRSQYGAVSVEFTAGTSPESVNPSLKAAVLLMVGHWYQNREAVSGDASFAELPLGVRSILDQFRVGTAA